MTIGEVRRHLSRRVGSGSSWIAVTKSSPANDTLDLGRDPPGRLRVRLDMEAERSLRSSLSTDDPDSIFFSFLKALQGKDRSYFCIKKFLDLKP